MRLIKKIKTAVYFAICGLILLAGNGCVHRQNSLLDFVPADSAAIVIIKWSAVRKDAEMKSMLKTDGFESQMRRVGIESEQVSEIVVFGASENRGGLLFRGKFDRRKIVENLKSGGWSETVEDKRKIYANQDDYAAFPADGIMAAGTREGIAAISEAMNDPKKNIQSVNSYKKIKASLESEKSPLTAYLIAPQETLDTADAALTITAGAMSLLGWGTIGEILKKLNVAEAAGFTIAHGSANQKYAVNLCVLMRDEKTASFAAGTLNLMKSFSSTVATESDEKENLQKFNVSRQEKAILLKMEMPRDALMPPDAK